MNEKELIEKANNNWKRAAKRKNDLEKEQRLGLAKFYYTIALYSAGAISLSITFLSTVIANYHIALSNFFFLEIENIYFLYFSWIAFGIAFLTGLLSRKYASYYTGGAGFIFESEAILEIRKKELSYINSIINGNRDFQSASNNLLRDEIQNDIKNMEQSKQFNGNKVERYLKFQNSLSFLCQLCGCFGLIFLIIFSISVSQAALKIEQGKQAITNSSTIEKTR